jgi:hypothetical protein
MDSLKNKFKEMNRKKLEDESIKENKVIQF